MAYDSHGVHQPGLWVRVAPDKQAAAVTAGLW
jgi:hypothetical protein